MKSWLFYSNDHKRVEDRTKKFLNKHSDSLSKVTADSLRGVGDSTQSIFEGKEKVYYYVVDVSTHRLATNFNMPNLTSVKRLACFYEKDTNCFTILMIKYDLASNTRITVKEAHFLPIEFLTWECLTIGALGWGQIQIADANKISIIRGNSRKKKKWMLELCDRLSEFYPREKMKHRIGYFCKVKQRWKNKEDIWIKL
ncbi:MAG: hypothetical protein N2234_01660 [Planctomycetota bacterium]|nr:hypothetical protein [Planctomycetota bacterium]